MRIIEDALNAAGTPEADVVFTSTDQNISRFANSNLHQNMSEISAELTLRVIVDEAMGVPAPRSWPARRRGIPIPCRTSAGSIAEVKKRPGCAHFTTTSPPLPRSTRPGR